MPPSPPNSTLVTLLLMAEHGYRYLSHMLDSEMGMPNVNLGQYSTLINDIIAMMQAMSMDMTEEEMATMEAHQMMVTEMMAMTTDEMLHSYDMAMGMEAMDNSMMTSLTRIVERTVYHPPRRRRKVPGRAHPHRNAVDGRHVIPVCRSTDRLDEAVFYSAAGEPATPTKFRLLRL